ncbi:MAG TPA: MFS transporter [Candidatus Paceibacterota bacterium]
MKHHHGIRKTATLYGIGIVGFFSALHLSLPTYFNSSFLSTFTNGETVGLIYLIISFVTIIGFLSMDYILQKIGNLRASLILIILQIIIFYGIITSDSFSVIAPLFILGMSVISLIGFTIDVFLQKNTDLANTGGIRGFYMTAVNTAWVLGPLLGGMFITETNYKGVYMAAFALLFPLLYLVYKNFNNFRDTHYVKFSLRGTIARILKNKDLTRIFSINIVLQTFYAWMAIYTPLYLHSNLGFSWSEIGIIFTIMLLPFVLIEWPLGKLADKKWGEKEILAIGFIIMAISTGALILFPVKSLITWSVILFITRIGAAAAEVMIETYFFKKVDGHDPEILSMFRVTRPLSYFIAPVIVTVGLFYTTDLYLFAILGGLCLLTLWPILRIKDTG